MAFFFLISNCLFFLLTKKHIPLPVGKISQLLNLYTIMNSLSSWGHSWLKTLSVRVWADCFLHLWHHDILGFLSIAFFSGLGLPFLTFYVSFLHKLFWHFTVVLSPFSPWCSWGLWCISISDSTVNRYWSIMFFIQVLNPFSIFLNSKTHWKYFVLFCFFLFKCGFKTHGSKI